MTRLVAPRSGARRSIHEVSVPLVGVSGAARPRPRPRATRGSLPAGDRARSAGSVRGPRRPGRNTASGGRRSSPKRACSRLRTTADLFPHATPPGGCRRVARDPRTGSSSPGTFRRGSGDRSSDVRSTNRPSRYCPAIAIVGAGPMSAARSSNDSMAHTSVRRFGSTSNLGFENVPMTCGAGFSDRMVSSEQHQLVPRESDPMMRSGDPSLSTSRPLSSCSLVLNPSRITTSRPEPSRTSMMQASLVRAGSAFRRTVTERPPCTVRVIRCGAWTEYRQDISGAGGWPSAAARTSGSTDNEITVRIADVCLAIHHHTGHEGITSRVRPAE